MPRTERKRRARPEQNLYNDHKAAFRALERQLKNDPDDCPRIVFIRDEIRRRKQASDDYAERIRVFRARERVRCAERGQRFAMSDYHEWFVALTAEVARAHRLRNLENGTLLFS